MCKAVKPAWKLQAEERRGYQMQKHSRFKKENIVMYLGL
jgi:hypothetical protein